ncbi:MAG: hypothetical protein KDA60_18875 [Planctomycetales bacterium]|nr:hypothetical protein [Planctomycetales bacterium]
MNYFAHGRKFLESPYFVAGTAVPDWLNVVNRRARARRKLAEPLTRDEQERVADVARGIVQHHDDDAWFHNTRAFAELSWQFTRHIRENFGADDSLRPMFLGHILVELLLDAVLIEESPDVLAAYYESLECVDARLVTETVARITGKDVGLLCVVIPRFIDERFLEDYVDDKGLLFRLNRVMLRVGLPEIPASFVQWLPIARADVASRREELLAEPASDKEANSGEQAV